VLLGTLTVFVFYVLQNYGPESAVRRYHEAIRTQNTREIQDVTQEPLQSDSQQFVFTQAQPYATFTQPRVLRILRSAREAHLDVAYIRNGRIVGVLPWYVEKPRGSESWRINTLKTARLMLEYQRML
jgi:hypothetical protein